MEVSRSPTAVSSARYTAHQCKEITAREKSRSPRLIILRLGFLAALALCSHLWVYLG